MYLYQRCFGNWLSGIVWSGLYRYLQHCRSGHDIPTGIGKCSWKADSSHVRCYENCHVLYESDKREQMSICSFLLFVELYTLYNIAFYYLYSFLLLVQLSIIIVSIICIVFYYLCRLLLPVFQYFYSFSYLCVLYHFIAFYYLHGFWRFIYLLHRKCKGMKAGRIRTSFSFPVHEMVTGFLEKAAING